MADRIVAEESALLARVLSLLRRREAPGGGRPDHDAELLELRDALAEAKPEDVPPLVEQMMRVSAVAAGRRGKAVAPVDRQAPYFGHLRLRPQGGPARDVLIGRQGFIDRQAGVQIVDWRDAPVSQIYYRYDEGDDYEEEIAGHRLVGIVEVRRNVTIQDGRLRRVACPQGTFLADEQGSWWQAETQAQPLLRGGQGTAARAPRPSRPHLTGRGPGPNSPQLMARPDKHLPEIAALIDPDQFALITEPAAGLLVIQGGAGSGKTTVALHRVAYLAYQAPDRFRPKNMLVVVPSEALVRYVSQVLPSLGVRGVPVVTCAGWLRAQRRRLLPHLPTRHNQDIPEVVSRLKKHPALVQVIDQYLLEQAEALGAELGHALQGEPEARARLLALWQEHRELPLVRRCQAVREAVARGALSPWGRQVVLRAEEALRRASRRARDVARDWAEILTDAGRLMAGLGASAQEVAALCAWCRAQQEEVDTLPEELDPERYTAVDGRPLDEDSPAGRLDPEDDAILLWLLHRKHGGLPTAAGPPLRYEHLVIDEAQDLSVLQVRLLLSCVRSSGDPPHLSATIAGDVAQRLVFDNGFRGWQDFLHEIGQSGGRVSQLRLLYRSTIEVMELARSVLGPLAGPETEQQATRSGAPVAGFCFAELGEAVGFLAEALRSLLGREPTASVALIARHAGTADAFYRALVRAEVPSVRRVTQHDFSFTPGVDVTEVTQVKGLEFDYVVILDATEAAYPDAVESRHLLHIAITRCAHQLWLLAAGPPTPLVPRSYFSGWTDLNPL